MENFFGKTFKHSLFLIAIAEIISYLGYLSPVVNKLFFVMIVLATLWLTLKDLRFGILAVLAELFIGSKGYLYFFAIGDTVISLRIALWIVVMGVWLAQTLLKLIRNKKLEIGFFKSSFAIYFGVFSLFIIFGVVNGILRNNSLNNVFFDFNSWLYLTLIFPLYSVFSYANQKDFASQIFQVFTAASLWISFKTLFLFAVFSHSTGFYDLYRWVRVSGVGEITQMLGGFPRIFIQSQIFVLIGFFLFLYQVVKARNRKDLFCYLSLCLVLLSAILISLSRSFWIGLAAGLILFFLFMIWENRRINLIFKTTGQLIGLGFASFLLIQIVARFPFTSSAGFDTADLLSGRATEISGEAGASSRMALLPVLLKEIKENPIFGKGYGATVTYKTEDPRILQVSPSGEYSTFAFEWGWLDIWIKLGLVGMLAYLTIIFKMIFIGLKQFRESGNFFNIFLPLGLVVIGAVSIFSPYMNHPLGLGYLIVAVAILDHNKMAKIKI